MLSLRIVTPERVEYDGAIKSIIVPGTMGSFEVLENHAPIISSLEKGVVEYTTTEGEKQTMTIIGGFIEVQKNILSKCVEII